LPEADWLQTLKSRFESAPGCAIGGRTSNTLANNPYATVTHLIVRYLYVHYNVDADRAAFVTSNNLALPTDRFFMLGGFDPSFPQAGGEDREFCHRWVRHGFRIVYAPEVRVAHAHVMDLRGFLRQHFNYGRGGYRFYQKRSIQSESPMGAKPISFYLRLIFTPFFVPHGKQAPLLTALMIMSQIMTGSGFFWERRLRYKGE
jgi:GT2 family glycosyltransferase